jgi:hypothetical protein
MDMDSTYIQFDSYIIFTLRLLRPWGLRRVEHGYKPFYNGSSGISGLGRVLKSSEVHLLPPFRPLLRHFPLTCSGTPAVNFLAWNEDSAKSASFSAFRHTLD